MQVCTEGLERQAALVQCSSRGNSGVTRLFQNFFKMRWYWDVSRPPQQCITLLSQLPHTQNWYRSSANYAWRECVGSLCIMMKL